MILAVDGGGTKTLAVIIDEKKLIVKGIGVSGPSNVRTVTAITSRKNILAAIRNAKAMAKVKKVDKSIYGIAGYGDSKYHTEELKSIISSMNKSAVITNDGEAAIYLITLGHDGIVTAIGTGSVGGYVKDGKINRIGGWSYLTDDMASGYWITRKALEFCEKSSDKLIENTELINNFENYFALPLRDLVSNLESHFNKRLMASMAILVDNEANNGDKIANDVLRLAFEEIKLMINGMKKNFENNVIIGSVGGVMQSSIIRNYLKNEFNDITIFYGYHVAIGNAMKLLNIDDFNIRNDLIDQFNNKINDLSDMEKELLFIK